jgi:Domain of unknown function (DUF4214)
MSEASEVHPVEFPPVWSHEVYPRRVNLGCGWDKREGYLNIDLHEFHNPDLVADVTQLTALPGGYYEEVLAIDVLEHIPRSRCVPTLVEWNRILVLGGLLRLQVPSLIGLLQLMTQPERQSIEQQEHLTQCLFGTQAYNGDFHLNGFTDVTITSRLRAAGFSVERLDIRDQWLYEVEARKTALPESEPWMVSDSVEEFVRMAYVTSLGREPDPGGLMYHRELVENGADRYVVLDLLRHSEEARRAATFRTPSG